jgi:putative component of membrane protein insertase Oxa1/YidC/SpoIIIJ protein YidD
LPRFEPPDDGARPGLAVGESEELGWLDVVDDEIDVVCVLGAACRTAASISLRTCSGSRPACSRYVGSSFQGSGLLVEDPPAFCTALLPGGDEPGRGGGEALPAFTAALLFGVVVDVFLDVADWRTAISISLLTYCGSKPVCSKYVGSSFQGSGLFVEESTVGADVLVGGGLDCWRAVLSAAGRWLEEGGEESALGGLEEDALGGGEASLGGGLVLCDVLLLAAAVALSHTCCGSRPVCSK